MLPMQKLVCTQEFWMETIQNDLAYAVKKYMDDHQINQTALANELGVSKGYISQVLNGHFNFTLQKLIEISLHIGAAPCLSFVPMPDYINGKVKSKTKRKRLTVMG
ncbi:helix-turn-helix domain-containing protein [Asinibacterium sp. OR53]|uniref:helix-turn-helix domain-containing protein n=1 Tax=Asinibacterium sp. OR53 TaxID=925409 RepID=UPI0004B97C51|nr:helix-turn-helix transcriptional regulator [Asinibacterium sp. OR53]